MAFLRSSLRAVRLASRCATPTDPSSALRGRLRQQRDREGLVLDRHRHHVRVVALDAYLGGEHPVDKALVVREMPDDDLAEIVDAAADRPALDHFRNPGDG